MKNARENAHENEHEKRKPENEIQEREKANTKRTRTGNINFFLVCFVLCVGIRRVRYKYAWE